MISTAAIAGVKNIRYDSNEELVKKSKVFKHYEDNIDELNKDLSHTEKIKKCGLVPDEWTVDSGDLTSTQKLKREPIKKKYEKIDRRNV